MNRHLVELPIVDATESPRRAWERMQKSGRSGVVYFDKGAPFVVRARDVVRSIVAGEETIAHVTHVRVGMRSAGARKFGMRTLPQPKAALVGVSANGTEARIVFRSAAKSRGLTEPPSMCRCRGPRRHPKAHDEHGEVCARCESRFDCAG
ncbi:MAG TPA: hypothetical protein VFN10_19530 [Thermoanaerobaculia bacterium]|nr:hypothetical protein [Thermoanaerobaculia bacterium]